MDIGRGILAGVAKIRTICPTSAIGINHCQLPCEAELLRKSRHNPSPSTRSHTTDFPTGGDGDQMD